MNFDHLREKLEKNGFAVSVFATGEEAAAYLNEQIDQRTVGMGGSMTIAELGLRESLSRHNVVFSHGFTPAPPAQVQQLAAGAEIYLLSANGIAGDTGEILNIDGTGNRVSSSLYGHRKVYLLAGRNKISPISTAPSSGCAMWWPPRTPSGWAARPPARPRGTGATTATARSASAGAWWCSTRRWAAWTWKWCWWTRSWAIRTEGGGGA